MMASAFRVARLSGLAVVSASTFAYFLHQRNNDKGFANCRAYQFYENRHESPQFTKGVWDTNWDLHEPIKKTIEESENDVNTTEKKDKLPTATRHVILIRHGQYNTDEETDELRILTEFGRQQAALTGKRLNELDIKFDEIVISTMTRAQETGGLICEHFPDIKTSHCSLLREGKPYPYEPSSKNSRSNEWTYQLYKDNPRIEAAFRKYFHRASPKQEKDSYELLVCHANVIRYFVCRALQFPPEGWLRMALAHGSITWVAIRPNGRTSVYSVGSFGHLPKELVTYS